MPRKDNLPGYKLAHQKMKSMSLKDISKALQAEVNSEAPRVDLITRLVGRYNRIDGARRQAAVLGLLSKRGPKNVDAVLANNG